MPDVTLHQMARTWAKLRDQRLAEIRRERITARMRATSEAFNAMAKTGIKVADAMRALGEAWAKAYPPR